MSLKIKDNIIDNFGVNKAICIKIHKKLGLNFRKSTKKIQKYQKEKINKIYNNLLINKNLKFLINENLNFKKRIKKNV